MIIEEYGLWMLVAHGYSPTKDIHNLESLILNLESIILIKTRATMVGKKIILGISGSIAAYKAATLTRLLVKAGAEVQILFAPSSNLYRRLVQGLSRSHRSRSCGQREGPSRP